MPHLKNYIIHKIRLIGITFSDVIDLFMSHNQDMIFGHHIIHTEGGDIQLISFSKEEYRDYKLDTLTESE